MKNSTLTLFMISMVFLISAGCISSTSPPGNTTTLALITPNVSISLVNQISSNETYWIHINPVGDHSRGDHFIINGTTNLPIGDSIGVQIYYASNPPGHWQEDCLREGGILGFPAVANISNGVDQWDTWSLDINSQNLCPDLYNVDVYPLRNSSAFNTTRFKLKDSK